MCNYVRLFKASFSVEKNAASFCAKRFLTWRHVAGQFG